MAHERRIFSGSSSYVRHTSKVQRNKFLPRQQSRWSQYPRTEQLMEETRARCKTPPPPPHLKPIYHRTRCFPGAPTKQESSFLPTRSRSVPSAASVVAMCCFVGLSPSCTATRPRESSPVLEGNLMHQVCSSLGLR